MTAKTAQTADGWTIGTYAIYQAALREADMRFDTERDRRIAEGAELRAVALKIKETADLAALTLARESQTLKEAQNDALRDKTLSESGIYATNASVTKAFDELRVSLQPLIDFVSAAKGASTSKNGLYALAAAVVGVIGVFVWIF